MIKRKQIFSILLSVFISVALVAVGVSATTVGTDISVSGDLDLVGTDFQGTTGTLNVSKTGSVTTVKGTLNVDEAVTLDSTLDIAGVTYSYGNLQVGGYATTVAATGNFSTEGTVTIGSSGTAIVKHLSTSTSIDLDSIATSTCATGTVSVGLVGVEAGDTVIASPTATNALIEAEALVWQGIASSSDDYVSLTVCNVGQLRAVDVGAQTWRFDVWEH